MANELNAVGWLALVAAMVLAAVLGGIVGQALHLWVPAFVVAGAALLLVLAVVADRVYFRSIYTEYSRWSRSQASEVKALAQRLREMGFDVSYRPPEPDEPDGYPGLRVRQRDWRAVRRVIDSSPAP